MAVIKSQNIPQAAAAFSMRDIETHARAMVQRAQAKAEEILLAAQQEADHLRETAWAEGVAAGRREGQREGHEQGKADGKAAAFDAAQAELATVLSSLMQTLTEVDAGRETLREQATSDVLRLAIALARRVTKRAGLIDPSVAVENVTAAVKLVVNKSDLRIALHPSQKQLIEDLLPTLKQTWPQLVHVAVVEDPAVAPGGCRVTTAAGEINAELDHQLDRITADLLPDAARGA